MDEKSFAVEVDNALRKTGEALNAAWAGLLLFDENGQEATARVWGVEVGNAVFPVPGEHGEWSAFLTDADGVVAQKVVAGSEIEKWCGTPLLAKLPMASESQIALTPISGSHNQLLGLHLLCLPFADSYHTNFILHTFRLFVESVAAAVSRLHSSKALLASEQRFHSLVNNIPGTTYRCLMDKNWTMTYLSAGIQALTGFPAEDFIDNHKRSFVSVIHPEDFSLVENEIDKAVSNKIPWGIEYRIIHLDGGVRWVMEKGAALFDNHGKVEFLDGFIWDITSQKLAHEAASHDEEIRREMEKSMLQMEKMASVGQLAAGVALFSVFPEEYAELVGDKRAISSNSEKEHFGLTHESAGKLLLNHWLLPEQYCATAGGHHFPEALGNNIAKLVAAAEYLAIIEDKEFLDDGHDFKQAWELFKGLGVPFQEYKLLLEQLQRAIGAAKVSFQVAHDEASDCKTNLGARVGVAAKDVDRRVWLLGLLGHLGFETEVVDNAGRLLADDPPRLLLTDGNGNGGGGHPTEFIDMARLGNVTVVAVDDSRPACRGSVPFAFSRRDLDKILTAN